ncbi:MAG: VOC family protein [Oscillatoriales cyanobacterium SM2_3_0]|nr:VOC family protein [Oscillatoriales cyanobacterium SM2_3_0]
MPLSCHSAFVTIADPEIAPLVEFYRQILGFPPQIYQKQVYAEFQLGGFRLGIFKPKQTHEPEFANRARTGLSLCLEVENLDRAIAHLNQLGYPPPGEMITPSHGREIYGCDPQGNRLILHEASHP